MLHTKIMPNSSISTHKPFKREGSLAQASSFRLGESSKSGTMVLLRSLA